MDSFNRGGATGPKLSSGARALPPLPQGGGVNQSCLTADMWFHSVIRYLPGQKGQSTATGCAILSQVAQGGAVARKVNVYIRHIRNTKGQRSGHGVYTTMASILFLIGWLGEHLYLGLYDVSHASSFTTWLHRSCFFHHSYGCRFYGSCNKS